MNTNDVFADGLAPEARKLAKTGKDNPEHLIVADQVYAGIRTKLITGAYAPGQKLTLRAVAHEFKVSMMPVRDAIKRLAAQGALQLNPNRTIQVMAPSQEQFEELLKIRAALEGLACEHAVKSMKETDINKIRLIGQRFEKEALRLRPNPESLAKMNRDFHFSIYRACKMPQLIAMIENLWVQLSPTLSLGIRHTAQGLTLRDAQRNHVRLIDSICKRDATRAKQALVADIREAGELIVRSGVLHQFNVPSRKSTPKTARQATELDTARARTYRLN